MCERGDDAAQANDERLLLGSADALLVNQARRRAAQNPFFYMNTKEREARISDTMELDATMARTDTARWVRLSNNTTWHPSPEQ